jgi:hypothetical protein
MKKSIFFLLLALPVFLKAQFPVEKIEIRFNPNRTKESQRDERIDEILKK